MGGTFTNWSALKAVIQNDVADATSEAEGKSYRNSLNNNTDYYSGSSPDRYYRTLQYMNSPRTTGVLGGGDSYHFDIYLDMGFNYDTGTWSTPKIFNAIEYGGGGVLGNIGRWAQTEEDIQKNIDEAFGKRFSRG